MGMNDARGWMYDVKIRVQARDAELEAWVI